ncbi:MAG: hypothetical protein ACJ04P_12315 [Halioglobus sp.]
MEKYTGEYSCEEHATVINTSLLGNGDREFQFAGLANPSDAAVVSAEASIAIAGLAP